MWVNVCLYTTRISTVKRLNCLFLQQPIEEKIIEDEKPSRKSPPDSDKSKDRDISLAMAPLPIPLPLGFGGKFSFYTRVPLNGERKEKLIRYQFSKILAKNFSRFDKLLTRKHSSNVNGKQCETQCQIFRKFHNQPVFFCPLRIYTSRLIYSLGIYIRFIWTNKIKMANLFYKSHGYLYTIYFID